MSLPFADIEDKYEILHKLGQGGMGDVYKVRHRLLGELRVIKVIRPQHAEQPELRERFRREAQAAIRLRHPNIAQVFDFSINEKGSAYTVMELIDGVTLKQLLARVGPPGLGLTMEIASQGLAALGYLHGQGYLHRDIAPDNLMLCRDFEGRPLVKLIDLGLAKRFVGDLDLTTTGMFMGKVRYSSPEQFSRAAKDPDARSDLYSFGVVLYELLTGQCPITGSSLEEVVASHLMHPVPDFDQTDLSRRVPKKLRQVVLRALEKSPEDRVGSAEELADLLTPFRDAGSQTFAELESIYERTAEVPRVDLPARVGTAEAIGLGPLASTVALGEHRGGAANSAGRRRRRIRAGLVAAGLVLLTVFGFWALRLLRPPPSAAHSLLVDAIPWARVESVTDAAGEVVPVEATVTPAVLSLAPGTYDITLTHPSFPESRSLTVDVPSAERPSAVEIGTVTPDAYFEGAGLAPLLREAGS